MHIDILYSYNYLQARRIKKINMHFFFSHNLYYDVDTLVLCIWNIIRNHFSRCINKTDLVFKYKINSRENPKENNIYNMITLLSYITIFKFSNFFPAHILNDFIFIQYLVYKNEYVCFPEW